MCNFHHMPALQCNDEKGKKSIIIMIPKPGKDHTAASSDRPISLLLLCLCHEFHAFSKT